ncbi:hypothetical protein [Pseudonocardia halophobica]|nr:hypothetical protein [Pseudonocardia halophobica]
MTGVTDTPTGPAARSVQHTDTRRGLAAGIRTRDVETVCVDLHG